ncbi:hypothetical protein NX794_31005 [Streptomyces sp. LP11]|uniref:Integral membrane protein n=1 Tax=Streptomyces pyxinicus TaxID=2970331 RepID=A0ABT2BAT9_9ACTN|nr:hypothetical protein [Streptomyces sp. LP11]MCS0605599.1 hypothetical protein [Streptomyces sp. LP11]
MAAGALLIGFAIFFLSPLVPWLLFPFQRQAGTVAAAIWGLLTLPCCFLWNREFIGPALLALFSSAVRIIVEATGTFEGPRLRRKQRKQGRQPY